MITSSIFATSAAPTQAGRGYFEIRRVDCGDGVSAGSSGSGGTGNPITSFAPNATEDSLIITLQDGTTLIAPSGTGASTTDTLYIASDTCVAARILHSAAQNIAASTTTQLNFGTESYDLGNNFSGNQFTVVEDGLYFINVQASVLLPGENDWTRLFILENGVSIASETENNGRTVNSSVGVAVNTTVFLTAGDVITSSIFTTSAAPTQAGRGYFEIRRVDCGDGTSASGTSLSDTVYVMPTPCDFGTDALDAALDITVTLPAIQNTTAQITLPTAGTYRITGDFNGQIRSSDVITSGLNGYIYDVTNALTIRSGSILSSDEPGNNVLGGNAITSYYTVTGPTVLRLQVGVSNLGGTDIAKLSARTQIHYERIDCGSTDGSGTSTGGSGSSTPQTLAYDPTTDSLTISGGNTISITPTPTYGMDFLDAQLDVTAEAPTYESTTTTITLPSAGIYRVSLNAHGQVRTTAVNPSTLMAQMYDVTNATSLGIFPVVGADEAGSNILGGSSYETFLTVTGPTVIEARVAATNQTAADVVRLRTTTQLLYQKLD